MDFICNRIGFFCGNYSNSCKMWFHLKLLFAKNMRKAERALAFRISGSKCPFLTYLLLRYSSKSFTNHRSDDHCNDHFYQVCRDEWDYTDCESCLEGVTCNYTEPYGSEKVTYDGSDDHTDKLDPWFAAVVDDQSGNDCHYDKSDDISTCRPCQFRRTTGETGEYREPNKTDQKIDQITDGSFFPSEKIQGQIDCQISE